MPHLSRLILGKYGIIIITRKSTCVKKHEAYRTRPVRGVSCLGGCGRNGAVPCSDPDHWGMGGVGWRYHVLVLAGGWGRRLPCPGPGQGVRGWGRGRMGWGEGIPLIPSPPTGELTTKVKTLPFVHGGKYQWRNC